MAVDPEQQAIQIRRVTEETRRHAAQTQRAVPVPERQREWIRQNNAIYDDVLIAIPHELALAAALKR